jgi:hypothetical protein
MWKLITATLFVLGTSAVLMAAPCASAVGCAASAPEIHPTAGIAAMTLLAGAVLIIRGRRTV